MTEDIFSSTQELIAEYVATKDALGIFIQFRREQKRELQGRLSVFQAWLSSLSIVKLHNLSHEYSAKMFQVDKISTAIKNIQEVLQ